MAFFEHSIPGLFYQTYLATFLQQKVRLRLVLNELLVRDITKKEAYVCRLDHPKDTENFVERLQVRTESCDQQTLFPWILLEKQPELFRDQMVCRFHFLAE